jgi:hypothetical protein
MGHLISDCYWEGGGKAGQFPAWFKNKRAGATNHNGGKFSTSANVTSSTDTTNQENEPHVYALSSMTANPYQVPLTEPIPRVANSDNHPNSRSLEITLGATIRGKELGYIIRNSVLDRVLAMSSVTTANDNTHLLTLLDLGATDHCFVNANDFSTYKPYSSPRDGHPANKPARFDIMASGTVELHILRNGRTAKVFLSEALHSPDLRHNLISV